MSPMHPAVPLSALPNSPTDAEPEILIAEVPEHVRSVVSITEKLDQARKIEEREKVCIHKIPARLRKSTDSKTYIPQFVSIGPYYHNRQDLQKMEQHKWRAVQQVLKRTRAHADLNRYLSEMRNLECKTRACYAGPLDLTNNEFVEMMLFDGCFILECFRVTPKDSYSLGYAGNDPVFSRESLILGFLLYDMLMLENQLPFFVLEKLLEIQNAEPPQAGLVSQLALEFFKPCMSIYRDMTNHAGEPGGMHCLDVVWQNLVRVNGHLCITKKLDGMPEPVVPSVTQLNKAGVKFRVKKNASKLWDITYENGIIHMPKIRVNDRFTSVLFNLMAFEQCQLSISWASYTISSYVTFLDRLIDSDQDVSYLRSRDILEHGCASNAEAVHQLDLLSKGIILHPLYFHLAPLCCDVNIYYKKKWNVWSAALKQRHFHNPWAIISFVAAVLLLLLTLGQTVYTIYGYYNPPT